MPKILIMEDDGDIAAIERDYLELNGYQVEIAADGTSGLARGRSGAFDLILLDLMLPCLLYTSCGWSVPGRRSGMPSAP